jgi:multiple sugar transport system substrate-binding protein
MQAESGAAIPAFIGTEEIWLSRFPDIDVNVYREMLPYARTFPTSKTKSRWISIESTTLMQVYTGGRNLDEAIDSLTKQVNQLLSFE